MLQGSNLDPKSIPGDLYHRPQRAPAQTNRRRRSSKALIANHPSFGGLSVFHYDYKRNQTSIREVCKLHSSTRLVQDKMVREANIFQLRPKGVVLTIGDR